MEPPEDVATTDAAFVVFDVETTGSGKTCQILQIAALYETSTFCRYIMPYKGKYGPT